MTREELLALVNKEVDTTKFKELSQKTIDEELDDVLEDFGDDEEANSKLVTKLTNRLKRINGNLHKNISDEVKKSKEEAERKKKEEEEERKRKEAKKGDDPDDKYSKLLEKLEALEKANAERDKKAARKATIESVKAGFVRVRKHYGAKHLPLRRNVKRGCGLVKQHYGCISQHRKP